MTKEEMIAAMAELIAGLQVPMSMSMPLGAAKDPWTRLHRGLHGFGWATAEDYEHAIRAVLMTR
ncbi:MAG TPA: hypothetical protein VGG75_14065 [Trebonia sp.]|jgi:hypothetical protein